MIGSWFVLEKGKVQYDFMRGRNPLFVFVSVHDVLLYNVKTDLRHEMHSACESSIYGYPSALSRKVWKPRHSKSDTSGACLFLGKAMLLSACKTCRAADGTFKINSLCSVKEG